MPGFDIILLSTGEKYLPGEWQINNFIYQFPCCKVIKPLMTVAAGFMGPSFHVFVQL